MDKIIAAAKVAAALAAAWLVSALAPFGIEMPADLAEGFFTVIFVGGASLLVNYILGWASKLFPYFSKWIPHYDN